MEHFEFIRVLGAGAFGKIHLARDKRQPHDGCNLVVVKEQRIDEFSSGEVMALAMLRHPNIVRYREHYFFPRHRVMYIVLEYCNGGDLAGAVARRRNDQARHGPPEGPQVVGFSEPMLRSWLVQCCRALFYCHAQHVTHRDLKNANVLVSNGRLKLADFGMARRAKGTGDFARTLLGTPMSLPPEVCARRPYNFRADMWCLGVMLFEWMTLQKPFTGETMDELMQSITSDPTPNITTLVGATTYSPEIVQLCESLLCKNPYSRPSAADVLNLQWLRGGDEQLAATEGAVAPLLASAMSGDRESTMWQRYIISATHATSQILRVNCRAAAPHYQGGGVPRLAAAVTEVRINVRVAASFTSPVVATLAHGDVIEVEDRIVDACGTSWLHHAAGYSIAVAPDTGKSLFQEVPEWLVQRPGEHGPHHTSSAHCQPLHSGPQCARDGGGSDTAAAAAKEESGACETPEEDAGRAMALLETLTCANAGKEKKKNCSMAEGSSHLDVEAKKTQLLSFLCERLAPDFIQSALESYQGASEDGNGDELWSLRLCAQLGPGRKSYCVPVLRMLAVACAESGDLTSADPVSG